MAIGPQPATVGERALRSTLTVPAFVPLPSQSTVAPAAGIDTFLTAGTFVGVPYRTQFCYASELTKFVVSEAVPSEIPSAMVLRA